MKNKLLSKVTSIACNIFIIWTLIILFIAYNKINNQFISKIGIGYVIYVFLGLIYMGIVAIYMVKISILNIRKLRRDDISWNDIRKRLLKFITIFIIFLGINIVFSYLIKRQVKIVENLVIPFGVAFGSTFFDILTIKRK
ncbi:hypothetical protein [Clostridium weizhouense]|uniref:Uncharacterized protein n=1 Tax=Clostridium weizhouense TaxID=2859781 RepID=A0ABS7AKP6_9CLOT|nr:hypothetical protein [Clostridium weizhouense]MBW6409235.1 hypothetical protein [Clostridium weizhouense]